MKKKELFTEEKAYLMWGLSIITGFPFIHRLYLHRYDISLIFYLIPGLGHILAFFDVFRMSSLVKEANFRMQLKSAFYTNESLPAPVKKQKLSIERVILSTAKKNKGITTPGQVALEGDISIDESKKYLEKLVVKGYAEMKIRKSGVIVYYFPDFGEIDNPNDFEDI